MDVLREYEQWVEDDQQGYDTLIVLAGELAEEIRQLTRERDEARALSGRLACQIDEMVAPEELRQWKAEAERLRTLLSDVRESYRSPSQYGFAAIIETDQRRFAAWLAKLDAALAREADNG